MKRRLAFLLALSLTFASLPVTGAGAAETAAATETEVVTEIAQEEDVEVKCEFCNKSYHFNQDDMKTIMSYANKR